MPKTITAIYEDGVLKPETPLDLPEHTPVKLSLLPMRKRKDHTRHPAWKLVGLFDGPKDLSRDPDTFLYGRKRKTP